MSGELVPKPRVVRCPTCRLLLPEPTECDVYKCGGCGTTLEAKKRKSVAVNSESSTQENDAVPRKALDIVAEGKQFSGRKHLALPREDSLKAKATTSSGECYLDGNVGRGQNENGEYNGGQLVPFSLSDEEQESELDIYKLSHRRHRVSNKGRSNVITHSEIEEINNGNLLFEGSKEEFEDGNNDKAALVGVKSEVEITESDLEGTEELNNRNLLLEGVEGTEELTNGSLLLQGAEEELNICAPDGEEPNNDQSAIEGAKSKVDTTKSASTTKRSSTEKGSILRVTPGKLEEGTSGNPVSSNKQQKQAQKNVHHSSDRVRSVDTLDTTELINPSSKLSGIFKKLPKSPTTRRSYGYDGSLSSYDGMDERSPIQHLDSFENAYSYTVANGVSEGRTRKGKGLVNSLLYGDLGTTHRQSNLPNEKHHIMKDRRGNKKEVLETTRHGHQRWMRTKRDEFPPRIPFHRSGSQSHYGSGSHSNQMHHKLYSSSSFLSPESFEDTDQEKMKLLRMVYKLQDQLNRTRSMSEETNGRMSTVVSYKGRFSHGLDYPRCNGRCSSHGVNLNQRHKFSRIPYSAEATSSAPHVDHPCFHCYPQERHFLADTYPHVLFQHEELRRSYPGQDFWSSHRSYPSSPQWFTPSKLPVYGHETKPDDQRHMAPKVRKYLREKKNLVKQHCKPIAGGAPFVTCNKCSKLLQVPADFLLFKRVSHKLRCGECSEVLNFSLQNGSLIVSFSPNAIVPPSSDLNDKREVISSSNLPSTSHANYYQYSHSKPISYYDDYGLSVSRSYSSSVGDPVSLTQFHPFRGSEYDNPSFSQGTFEPIKEEKIASRYSSTTKAPVETCEPAFLSSNVFGSGKLSSEMEARPPPKSSTLHQLMGYSSPSQVIRGTQPSSS